VTAETTIGAKVSNFPVPESEWALWRLDQEINLCGVYVDRALISGAQHCSAVVNEELIKEAARIAGIQNPKSVAQLKAWINDETDENVGDLKKATVADLITTTDDDALRRMLQIRQEVGKTSVKKYAAMEAAVGSDGKVRGLVQFYGANRTGRWAGRLVQVQNLPRNYIEPLELARNLVKAKNIDMLRFVFGGIPDTLSQLIRTAFIPSPGHVFTVADFSAIEARVIAWLAGEVWRQQIFASHGKIYEASASAMFGVPLEKIARGNPEYALRQKGKIAELALGYQGSSGALIAMGALNQGLTEEELPDIVRRWRAASPRIVDLWYACERAAVDTIKTGRINVVKYVAFAREIDLANGQDFLTIQLPSGRKLYYNHPSLVPGDRGDRIQYYGVHQKTHKWGPLEIYGGKFVENITQAIARDCLAVTLQRLAAAGFNTVFHVHDEAILDTPADAQEPLRRAIDIMAQPITWAPGLLLRADGFTTEFYKKD
jgi:DNA polymerase